MLMPEAEQWLTPEEARLTLVQAEAEADMAEAKNMAKAEAEDNSRDLAGKYQYRVLEQWPQSMECNLPRVGW